MNEEKKKNHSRTRINCLDVFLILLLVLCVVSVWQRNNLKNLFESEDTLQDHTISFEIKALRATTAVLLTKDAVLYLGGEGEHHLLGRLLEDSVAAPASVELSDGAGNTIQAVYPQDDARSLKDVTGTLVCSGFSRDGAFFLGGTIRLAVNQTVSVCTERVDLEIRIIDINEKT
ncbi:MAG: hypothetical protein E7663_00170 [Ruminococcaceae bacterium]|nr:hypothetical protein [Oscillospiraceae bacterium]